MKFAQSFLPLLLLAAAKPAAADALTNLFPADTKVVIGVRMHNLAISPLARTFTVAAGANWQKMVSLGGFDPLRDIDEVMIASAGEGAAPTALIVAAGRFSGARHTENARTYHGVPILGGEQEGDPLVAFPDDFTALGGDPGMVRAAIDCRQGGARIDPALNDRITSLRQRYDVWGLGQRAEGFPPPIPEAKGLLESIDRFQFTMQLATGLEMGAELHARTPQDAEKLNKSLQAVSAALQSPDAAENAGNLDVQAQGSSLKVAVSIPDAELAKMIQAGIGDPPVTSAASAPAPDPPSAPEAAAPPVAIPDVIPEPALPVAPAAVADPLKAAPKPVREPLPSQVMDKEGNTVILKLPGKK